MNEGLVAEIVRQILADPVFRKKILDMSGSNRPGSNKPKLLVMTEKQAEPEGIWDSILKRWEESYSLYCLGTSSFDCPEGVISITEEEAEVFDWQRVVVPSCSVSTYVRAALGLRDDTISKLVSQALLAGIPVEMKEPDFGFTSGTNEAYKNLYKGYSEQLQSFGVIIIDSIWSEANPMKAPENSTLRDEGYKVNFTKKLLAEKDALALPQNCILKIPKRTVISPLARDVLKMRKIQFVIDGEAL